MFLLFILAVFYLIIALVILLVITRLLGFSVTDFDGPMQIPARIGWSVLLAAVALNVVAYDVGPGIGYGLFGIAVFASILLVFPTEKRQPEVWFLAIVGSIACLSLGFRANEFVQIVNGVTAILCAGALVLLRSIETLRWNVLWILTMKLGFLTRITRHPFTLRSANSGGNGMLLTALKTTGITVIVLLFFSWILSAADPVFGQIVDVVREQALGRIITSGLLVTFLLVILSVTLPKAWQETLPQFRGLGFVEIFVPALSLALLFGLFLGIQATYLFGGHTDFQALGITYADYVHRGFVELLIASAIGSVLSYVLILKHHTMTDARKILQLQWVNGVLLVELLLLLLSAAKRDWMYIEVYGLTRVRLIGAIFLLWLFAIILLISALNAVRGMTEKKVLIGAGFASALVVLILNAANLDRIIALYPSPSTQHPDVVTMSKVSADAVDGWLAAIAEIRTMYATLQTRGAFTTEEKTQLANAKVALGFLHARMTGLSDTRPWQEWNWSRSNAVRQMNDSAIASPLELVLCLRQGIRYLQVRTGTNLYEEEQKRTTNEYSRFMSSDHSYWPESLESIQLSTIVSSMSPVDYDFPSCERRVHGSR